MIALLIGGSGSGKSSYAERLFDGTPPEKRVYIATMRVCDAESERRVARHRAMRAPLGFRTCECRKDLGGAAVDPGSAVLLEDIPNLLANELFDGGNPERILPGFRALAEKCARLIVVTGDVFSDGAIYDALTRDYQRRLARINAAIAETADCVVEVVCSIPIPLKGALPCAQSHPL